MPCLLVEETSNSRTTTNLNEVTSSSPDFNIENNDEHHHHHHDLQHQQRKQQQQQQQQQNLYLLNQSRCGGSKKSGGYLIQQQQQNQRQLQLPQLKHRTTQQQQSAAVITAAPAALANMNGQLNGTGMSHQQEQKQQQQQNPSNGNGKSKVSGNGQQKQQQQKRKQIQQQQQQQPQQQQQQPKMQPQQQQQYNQRLSTRNSQPIQQQPKQNKLPQRANSQRNTHHSSNNYWNEELVPLKGCEGCDDTELVYHQCSSSGGTAVVVVEAVSVPAGGTDDSFCKYRTDKIENLSSAAATTNSAAAAAAAGRRRNSGSNRPGSERSSALSSSLKEKSLSVISITASLVALVLCAAWALSSTFFGNSNAQQQKRIGDTTGSRSSYSSSSYNSFSSDYYLHKHHSTYDLSSSTTSGGGTTFSSSALSQQQQQQQQEELQNKQQQQNSNNNKNKQSSPIIQMLKQQQRVSSLYYDEMGRYIVPDYDAQPPFSDFLPGLAGYYGKPLYAFYVNRGQGIASFGIKSKDYPIMEFQSANKAYQSTPLAGFRTFVQLTRKTTGGGGLVGGVASNFNKESDMVVLEPFSPLETRYGSSPATFSDPADSSSSFTASTPGAQQQKQQLREQDLPRRFMYVGTNEVQIQEIDLRHGIEVNVTFFILPEEDFGAFVKRTTITNIFAPSTNSRLTVSMLDGLAHMQPAGGPMDSFLKNMGRTLEGWMGVYQPYSDTTRMPFYRLSTEPRDSASVIVQKAGHWCLSVLEEDHNNPAVAAGMKWPRPTPGNGEPVLLPIIYDPSKVFGQDVTMINPVKLYQTSIDDIIQEPQYSKAKTPSAFAATQKLSLEPGESATVSTFFGKAEDILEVPVVARRLLQTGFVQYKLSRSREIIRQITASVETKTAQPIFDGHVQQMLLDNSLRGGIPSILGEVDDDAKMRSADEDQRLKVYHLFSRIHGDLERDYNDFNIAPTFFSQGPGNFRDVIQNRRNDVQFNPRIGSFNIRTFLSFIQADGYEPLTVEAVIFTIENLETCKIIAARAVGEADGHRAQREALTGILNSGPFRPGQVFLLMEEQHIELIISKQDFIDELAAASDSFPMAVYKSGFWADHFTYYLDLIDSFLTIYPDWEERILFEQSLPYFFSPAYVKPRDEKYVLSTSFDGFGVHVRQLEATTDADVDKVEFQRKFIQKSTGWFDYASNWQHSSKGNIFASTPMEKLFLLATLKFATRDAYGMGIEYEGGRPGWNDANNGLVGMVGSGMPETYELKLILRYIQQTIKRYSQSVQIPCELHELIVAVEDALDRLPKNYTMDAKSVNATVPQHLFDYWDAVATARETYRAKTKVTFHGNTTRLGTDYCLAIVHRWLDEIDLGIQRAHLFGTKGEGDDGTSGISPTYFSYSVTDWEKTGELTKEGHPLVSARGMRVNIFPLFLESPTRMMKTLSSEEAFELYQKVKSSELFDKKLGMYKISASLKGQSFDMGREMAFASGWLENESVWLHMSYKFYLELIRHGQIDAFYDEMTSGGMLPFMDPGKYGRSLMECSSFIASSAFEDPGVRGRGFLARSTGATAEYLSMWLLMMTGPNLFYKDPEMGDLRMKFLPALPRWLFSDKISPEGATTTIQTASATAHEGIPRVMFKLFGAIDVTYYHNRGEENLYGVPPTRYVIGFRDGSTFNVDGPSIPSDLADKIRRVVFVASIEAYFEP